MRNQNEEEQRENSVLRGFFCWNTTLYNCAVCVFNLFIFWLTVLSKEIFSCRIFIYDDSKTVHLFPMKVKIIFGTDDLPFGKNKATKKINQGHRSVSFPQSSQRELIHGTSACHQHNGERTDFAHG